MTTESHRIMLVEDENIIAMDIQQRLEKLGYEVVAQAASGPDAIRAAAEKRPDLILMDIKIRGPMDGIETAAKIRTAQDIPVIYLTAFADETTIKRASLTEAFGYLLKPFEDRELHSAIEIALYKDIMEKKLRASEERYALATQAANDGIWDWDLTMNEIFFSSRWRDMLGFEGERPHASPEEWLNRVHPMDRERLMMAIDAHLQSLTPALECEYRILHQDGGHRWMLCRGLARFDAQAKPYRMAGSQSDITVRKQLEEQLIRKALYDELTRLPNRALFIDRLNIVLEQVQSHRNKEVAVLFLDIDHFKIINDSLGHACGDALLVAFSQRLEQCFRPGDTVSRFGGDEFAILVDGDHTREEIIKIADRVCEALKKPFLLDCQELFAHASIGVVFANDSYRSTADLLRDADIAMYHSKKNGRSRYEIFHTGMREHTLNRLRKEGEIQRALRDHEFILYYQPVIAVEDMQLVGFEALLRWQHPTQGLLAPSEFIDIAEQSGLIIPLGEWVLHAACLQAQAWNEIAGRPLRIAINLSALQLNDKKLIESVRSALTGSGLDPKCLELELTETTALNNIEHTKELMQALRQMGISIGIDDFGKGYSSLDYIKKIPSNTLKIDRSFITDFTESGTAIVSAIVTMAHQLYLKVTAEGVETEDQLKLLRKLKCDQVQGFHLSKPLPAEDVLPLLRASHPSAAR